MASDWLSAENSSQAKSDNSTATGGDSAVVADNNPYYGNLVWRAAQRSLGNGRNVLSAFTDNCRSYGVRDESFWYGGKMVKKQMLKPPACPQDAAPEACVKTSYSIRAIDNYVGISCFIHANTPKVGLKFIHV